MTEGREAVLARAVSAAAQIRKYHKLSVYEPYPKQAEFHRLGKTHDERALIAGNQVGKTLCGCSEDAIHLTGEYPSWWEGHRFDHPIVAWLAGPNGEKVRDNLQFHLFGPWSQPERFGTGYLPRDAIIGRPTLSRGVSGFYDTALIKWKDKNGRIDESAVSTLVFKSFTEGQLAFASDTIDYYHGDEEGDQTDFFDLYIEARTRLQVRRGISIVTLTPLRGWTPFVCRFLRPDKPAANRTAVNMGLYDAKHYTRAHADQTIAGYPDHLRDCKAFGVPAIGQGKIFMTPEDSYKVPRFDPPAHFAKLWGIDLGGAGQASHPFGAALIAWDRDFDIIYLTHALKLQGMTKLQHIPKMREIAADVWVAWPHDAHEKREGPGGAEEIAKQYKRPMPGMPGLKMLPAHATWPDGGFSTEAAIVELDDRMSTGRFKAFADLEDFWFEVRQYHRDNGLIVKLQDDILSALFKALMQKRSAKPGMLSYQMPVAMGKYAPRTDEWWRDKDRNPEIDPWTNQPVATA